MSQVWWKCFASNNLESKQLVRQLQVQRQRLNGHVSPVSQKYVSNMSTSQVDEKPYTPTGKIKNKILTLKQTKDIIEEIYESKNKYDVTCMENRIPRETMEQHMYTYLNQKYGLKSLILEMASALHHSVLKYADEDNECAVFYKIVKNEIDEEFRFVQQQLKESVADLLRVHLKGKYQSKLDSDIQVIYQKKMESVLVVCFFIVSVIKHD